MEITSIDRFIFADHTLRFMKKAKGVPDELRAEYKRSDFGKLERGKYFERVKASADVIVLDAEVAAVFSNSASVNKALHGLVEVAQKASGLPRRSTAKRALTPFLRDPFSTV